MSKDRTLERILADAYTDGKLLHVSSVDVSEYPHLTNFPAGAFYKCLPIPTKRKPPEFVLFNPPTRESGRYWEVAVPLSEWNMAWESGQDRINLFWDRLPTELQWLQRFDECNLYVLPSGKGMEYYTYGPLYELLPARIKERHRLLLFNRTNWPFIADHNRIYIEAFMKGDVERRLSRAFASHIWPLLSSSNRVNPIGSFTKDDPLKLLAHDLKFWLPAVYRVCEDRVLSWEPRPPHDAQEEEHIRILREQHPELNIQPPSWGGSLWRGEDDAWEATQELVDYADSNGQIRGIVDAIKSNRVQDDFTDRIWSRAKEDFERKLYHKRNKVRVRFVEVDDAIPIHNPSADIHENLLWDGFMSLLNHKEKEVIVCLRKGLSQHLEISAELGYAGHSSVTKLLARIRKKAETYFSLR